MDDKIMDDKMNLLSSIEKISGKITPQEYQEILDKLKVILDKLKVKSKKTNLDHICPTCLRKCSAQQHMVCACELFPMMGHDETCYFGYISKPPSIDELNEFEEQCYNRWPGQ